MQVDIQVKKPVGLNSKEKRHFGALCERATFLFHKTHSLSAANLSYAKAELSALEWALNVVSEHYEHINICED